MGPSKSPPATQAVAIQKIASLEMPGAGEVVGQDAGQVEAIEGSGLHAVMRDDASQCRLRKEQDGHHDEVEAQDLLARRELPCR